MVAIVNSIKASHTLSTSEMRPLEQCNVVTLRSGNTLVDSNAKEKLEAGLQVNHDQQVEKERKKMPVYIHAGKAPTDNM